MGSIQVFPKRSRIGTLADVWRHAPLPGPAMVQVRPARAEDFAMVHSLHRRARPDRPAIAMKVLESQRHHFAEGQLVADSQGEIAGAASSLVVDWEPYSVAPRRAAITGGDTFASHDPAGDTLFAADTFVESASRGSGVGRALLQARRQLCRTLNLRRIVMVAPLSGFTAVRERFSPEQFATRIVMGDAVDAYIRFHLAQGFQFCGVARDYDPADLVASGHGAILAWLNPHYTPPGPGAREAGASMRRCA
jgi:GNAT superfamily N-acetyltransferase